MKRSRWHRKPRVRKELWRTGQIIEDAEGMRKLRLAVFHRAGGRCEAIREDGQRCNKFAKWDGFGHGELSHEVHRGRGGSDVESNCFWSCPPCHRRRHPGPQWSEKIA